MCSMCYRVGICRLGGREFEPVRLGPQRSLVPKIIFESVLTWDNRLFLYLKSAAESLDLGRENMYVGQSHEVIPRPMWRINFPKW